jgi:6-phosphogluconolactonase
MLRIGLLGLAVAAIGVATVVRAGAARAAHVMYVGTYTGAQSKGIYAFRFDDASGTLEPAGLVAETPSPSFLEASADGRYIFAVNETSAFDADKSGSVSSFAIDRATLKLTPINTVSSRGGSPCHLMLDRTGKFLAVANYGGGSFAILPVGADGRLGAATAVLTHTGSGPNKQRQEKPHAHMVLFDPANKFLYGADLGLDVVHVYRFNAASGAATPNDPPSGSVAAGAGPRHIAFHPNGRFAYVIDELASTITTFDWDASAGTLKARGSISTLPTGFTGTSTTAEIAIHPSGRFLYGSNRGHDSIAVFRIADDGSLTLVETQSTRGHEPRNFTIDPSGRWLIAANQNTNTLAVFRIDQTTGALTPSGPLASVGSPVSLLFVKGL